LSGFVLRDGVAIVVHLKNAFLLCVSKPHRVYYSSTTNYQILGPM
jgi:hypothetical protein